MVNYQLYIHFMGEYNGKLLLIVTRNSIFVQKNTRKYLSNLKDIARIYLVFRNKKPIGGNKHVKR